MVLVIFFLYILIGMACAYWIFRDGEFRPIDSAVYMISAVLLWPIVVPAWMVLRPPSQVKDLTWEKSYGHYKHWQKTHKVRDIGDIDNLDKTSYKGNGSKQEENEEIMGATSPDNPYVIGGKSKRAKSTARPSEQAREDDYGWDEVGDRAPQYEIGTTAPRQAYNPFKKNNFDQDSEPETLVLGNGAKSKTSDSARKDSPSFNVPSISDILDDGNQPKAKKETKGPFRDANVRKLIDDQRLRDAYRVARRMLKVAQELGEEDRVEAYQRYLREIENRMKAAEKRGEG